MPAYSTVLLTTKGEVRKANLTLTDAGELTLDTVHKYLRKKDAPELLGSVTETVGAGAGAQTTTLTLFGYTKGKSDTVNHSTFPAALAEETYYGDVLVVASPKGYDWRKPMTYLPERWAAFTSGSAPAVAAAPASVAASVKPGAAAAPAKAKAAPKPKAKGKAKAEDSDDEVDEEDDSDSDSESEAEEEAEEAAEDEKSESGSESDSESEVEEEDEEEEEDDEEEGDDGGDDEEGEMEAEPQVAKRKKGKKASSAAGAKIDAAAYKEELSLDTPASSHPLRTWCLSQLAFLEEHFDKEDVEALEVAIFTQAAEDAKKRFVPRSWKAQPFHELYRAVSRKVLWNLHPRSPVKNARLLVRCEEGEFPLSAIAAMTAYEMYPENWKELADRQLIREQKILEGNRSRATDKYKCNRCGKRECTYYEMQTRSADEPMTVFITCLNCGKQWKN